MSVVNYRQHLSLANGQVTALAEFLKPRIYCFKLYGKLSRLFKEAQRIGTFLGPFDLEPSQFLCELHRLLLSGCDLNQLMFAQEAVYDPPYPITPAAAFYKRVYKQFRYPFYYDLLQKLDIGDIHHHEVYLKEFTQVAEIVRYFKFLLRNGLAFFYGYYPDDFGTRSVLVKLIEYTEERHMPTARAIAHQLLALGYGRSELHPGGFPVRDERLADTRQRIDRANNHCGQQEFIRNAESFVKHFNAGPMTLQQLARIAIRRAVGGVYFEQNMRTIAHLMPPPLFKYVAKAKEMLHI